MLTDRRARLEGLLEKVSAEPGVVAALLVSRDGIPVMDASRRAGAKEAFAAMSATLMGAAEIALAEFGGGGTRRVIAEANDLKLIVTGATADLVLVVLAETRLPLERFLPQLEARAGEVAAIVAG